MSGLDFSPKMIDFHEPGSLCRRFFRRRTFRRRLSDDGLFDDGYYSTTPIRRRVLFNDGLFDDGDYPTTDFPTTGTIRRPFFRRRGLSDDGDYWTTVFPMTGIFRRQFFQRRSKFFFFGKFFTVNWERGSTPRTTVWPIYDGHIYGPRTGLSLNESFLIDRDLFRS